MASALGLARPRITGIRGGCYVSRRRLDASLFQPPLPPDQRAAQRRHAGIKNSVAILRQHKSEKYQAKMDAAQERWEVRAKQVKDGEVQNTWDMLVERGCVKEVTGSHEQMSELMRLRRVGVYAGVDPTADSLHIGHLATFMPVFWMYIHGYRAFTLIGATTAKIGDPIGRLTTRPKMKSATLALNLTKIHYQLKKMWGMTEVKMRELGFAEDWARRRGLENNSIWWNSLALTEVMRYIGNARLGPLLSRDTCKTRLVQGEGLSLAEFMYPLIQGYDWFKMMQRLNVQVQVGGSDQFGNIVTGIEVIKLARESETDPDCKLPSASWMDDPCGFTVPLLTDKKGRKFGKSENNAIWLDAFKTSVFDFYGFFVRQPDDKVEQLMKRLTFAPFDQIKTVMDEHKNDPPKRIAQHFLAHQVTGFIHGYKAAHDVQRQHTSVYSVKEMIPVASRTVQRNVDAGLQYTTEDGERVTLQSAPRIDMILPRSAVTNQMLGAVLHHAGMASSRSEGHRLQLQQGIYVGATPGRKGGMDPGQIFFTPIKLWTRERTDDYLIDGELLILRRGKHNIRIIKVISEEEYEASGQTYPGQPLVGRTRQMLEKIENLSAMTSQELCQHLAAQSQQKQNESLSHPEKASGKLMFPEFAAGGQYIPNLEKRVGQLIEKVRQAKGDEDVRGNKDVRQNKDAPQNEEELWEEFNQEWGKKKW